jgi:hypothetical protein
VRARFVLNAYEQAGPERLRLCWGVQMEVENVQKPALVADWLGIIQLSEVKV